MQDSGVELIYNISELENLEVLKRCGLLMLLSA